MKNNNFMLLQLILITLQFYITIQITMPQTNNFLQTQAFNSIDNPEIWVNFNNSEYTDKCQTQKTFEYTLNGQSGHFTAVGCGCNLLIIQTTTGDVVKKWGGFRYQGSDLNLYKYYITELIFFDNKLYIFTHSRCLVIKNLDQQPDSFIYNPTTTYADMTEYTYINRYFFKVESVLHFKYQSIIATGNQNGKINIYSLLDGDFLNEFIELSELDSSYQVYNIQKVEGLNLLTAVGGQHAILIFQICEIDCKECNMTSCTACIESTKTPQNCQCDTLEYLDFENIQCSYCSSPCKECISEDNKCTECFSGKGLDSTDNTCSVNCESQCKNCLDLPQNCTQCQASYMILPNCTECIDGRYLNTNDQQCYKCQDLCTKCQNSEDFCLECKPTVTFDNNTCNCLEKQFYHQLDQECKNCLNQCQKCESSTKCTECIDVNMELPYCFQCKQGYYFDMGNTNLCQKCNQNCLECKVQENKCQTCKPGFTYNSTDGTCNSLCNQNEYFDQITNQCELCDLNCQECIDSKTNCIKCNELKYLILKDSKCECQYMDNYYDSDTNSCKTCTQEKCQYQCADNQYYDTDVIMCEICTEDKCASRCTQNQYYNTNLNMCQQCTESICASRCTQEQYYDVVQNICQQCSEATCAFRCTQEQYYNSNLHTCEQCTIQKCASRCNNEQYYDTSLNMCQQCTIEKCPCELGKFYDISTNQCKQCQDNCKSCVDEPNKCTECFENFNLENHKCYQILSENTSQDQNLIQNEEELEQEQEQTASVKASATATAAVEKSSKVVVSSFFLLAIFGYFYMLISIIDFTQLLFMLMYINLNYKPNLLAFFKALQSFALPYIPHMFKYWAYDEDEIRKQDKAPENFTKHGYYSFFLENIGLSSTILLIPFAFIIVFYLLGFKTKQTKNNYINMILVKCQKIFLNMRYSSPIELMFMEFVNIPAACLIKIIYAMIIVPFYNYPHLQIILLGVVHILLIIYMLYVQPFTTIGSLIVNVITEAVFVMCLFIILFACNEEICTDNGTVIIFSAIAVLFMHIIYIVSQILLEKIDNLKKIFKGRRQLQRQTGNRKMAFNSEQIGQDLKQIKEDKVQIENILPLNYNKIYPESQFQSKDQSIHLIGIEPPLQNKSQLTLQSSSENTQENKTEEWDPNLVKEKKLKINNNISQEDIPQKSSSRKLRSPSIDLTIDSYTNQEKILKRKKLRKLRKYNKPNSGSIDYLTPNNNQHKFSIKSLNNIQNDDFDIKQNTQIKSSHFIHNNDLFSPASLTNSIQQIYDSKQNILSEDQSQQNNPNKTNKLKVKPRRLRQKKK